MVVTETRKATREHVLKEYPNLAYWLEGRQAKGAGNLILTNERLIFLNRVVIADWQKEKIRQLAQTGFDEVMDFALKLHKKNFAIPLSQVIGVRMGLFSLLPIPRLCMRVNYRGKKKDSPLMETGFWFRIPLFKSFSQLEITLVMGWLNVVKKAVKAEQTAS